MYTCIYVVFKKGGPSERWQYSTGNKDVNTCVRPHLCIGPLKRWDLDIFLHMIH